MRGEVFHYDEAQGFGFIAAADGNRYTFRREDLRRAAPMDKGTVVEFQPSGGQAKDVFSIRAQLQGHAPAPAAAPPPQHFGRMAVADGPAGPGLWGYFWAALTRNYANFQGRSGRKEYWAYILFWVISMVVLVMTGFTLDGAVGNLDSGEPWLTGLFLVGPVLATVVPWAALLARRMHDLGMSGWFCLLVLGSQLFLLPLGLLLVIVFGMIPADPNGNRWGPGTSGGGTAVAPKP
jgi:uncharacterized membrane protein YhaH (DUF805 family)/cold shock CspA family protein